MLRQFAKKVNAILFVNLIQIVNKAFCVMGSFVWIDVDLQNVEQTTIV